MNNTIYINSSNVQANNTNKNVFEYTLPTSANFVEGDTVSLTSVNMYNSFFNIRASLGNNQYSYVWPADNVTYYVTIDDGFHDIEGINYYFQYEFIKHGHYMVDENGDNVYFMELLLNPSAYGTNIKFTPLPTAVEAVPLNWSIPVGEVWTLPVTAKTLTLTFATGFGLLFGYEPGTYPSVTTDFITTSSTLTGAIQQVSTLIFTTNIVNNSYSNPSNTLASMNLNASYGNIMSFMPNYNIEQSIFPGNYRKIVVSIYDQNFNPATINDLDSLIIALTIKTK